MVLGVPRHVLADSLQAIAMQPDDGGYACEAARDRFLEALEAVSLDLERQARDARVGSGRGH
jgi:hypothetical protein